ncbi:MAG: hypothetical protein QOH20_3276 [Mycobacterium sp.]|nr:hypothetical protein [Mycobacterium sp.]
MNDIVDTINGLPAHPLLVHVVVVFVPVAAMLAIVAVAWPAARRRLGWAPLIAAVIALVAIPLTTNAGEWLQAHKRPSELISRHAELGDQLIYWVAPARRNRRPGDRIGGDGVQNRRQRFAVRLARRRQAMRGEPLNRPTITANLKKR